MFGYNKSSGVSWLVAGLGNPGAKYASTRHNAGFWVVEQLAEKLGIKLNKVKFHSTYNIAAISGQKALIMKPQTYMNLSGEAVREASSFYKIPPERILVIFDDVSLPPGRIRIRKDGSAGGHNGIKSIINECQTQDFPRIKLGIGSPPREGMIDWVTSVPSAGDQKLIIPAVERAADAVFLVLDKGVNEAANRYNGAE